MEISARFMFQIFTALILVGVAAVRHFGWLDGLAITAAVWLLMPMIDLSERGR